MRLEHDGDERNIQDLRGQSGGAASPGRSGGGGLKLGLGGTAVVLVLSLVFGRNLFADLGVGTSPGGGGMSQGPSQGPSQGMSQGPSQGMAPGSAARGGAANLPGRPAGDDTLADRTKAVFNDAQRMWVAEFRKMGKPYREAKLVLFTDSVRSGCGYAESAMGPFYCPADERVFIDLGFYQQLKNRFRAPGDFAQAYVIAHEVGHHVQTVLGTEERVRRSQRANPEQKNGLSVRMELQADCYAGMWAKSTDQRQLLDVGDIDEGLGAAAAVGDDRIQAAATGRVNPERWTHGSAKDRAAWFRRGFQRGDLADCDTFAAR